MAGMDDRSETTATTLLVRHLPEAIPESTLSRLFSHYGASSVRSFSSNHNSKLRNCAFLDFHDQAMALQAQRHLNGLRFLGKVLKVERATNPQQPAKTTKTQQDESRKDQSGGTHEARPSSSFGDDEVVFAAESIASRLGVDYPYPPHLEYAYPPPDGNILTNIVNALIAVPRFYTQVLHLMNKMNIPAPFRMALPTPPLPPTPGESKKQPLTELSSEESEMESSDEEVDASRRSKRVKRDNIVGPAVDKDVSHESVGVKAAALLPKEIPVIKKRNPVLQIKIAPKSLRKEHVDNDSFVKDKEESKTESVDIIQPYATPEEIQNGKLGPDELLSLPMFKNYKVGAPASVLYIKNLAKDVVNDDFYYIFGSLFGSIDLAKSSLSVKLMQEGRMRGQAFVTFSSIELAHRALNLVNGFEFKGKPMVIQFGRNPAASKEKE